MLTCPICNAAADSLRLVALPTAHEIRWCECCGSLVKRRTGHGTGYLATPPRNRITVNRAAAAASKLAAIQAAAHDILALDQCQNDTDGDGTCHICASFGIGHPI